MAAFWDPSDHISYQSGRELEGNREICDLAGGTPCALCLCVLGDTGVTLGVTGITLGVTGITLDMTGATGITLGATGITPHHHPSHSPGWEPPQFSSARCRRETATSGQEKLHKADIQKFCPRALLPHRAQQDMDLSLPMACKDRAACGQASTPHSPHPTGGSSFLQLHNFPDSVTLGRALQEGMNSSAAGGAGNKNLQRAHR